MLKLVGAALLTGGGLALGLGAAGELAERIAALNALSAALGLLESELALRAPATPELMELLAQRAPEPAAALFREVCRGLPRLGEVRLQELWGAGLAQLEALTDQDRRPLLELGAVLGRYDVEAQARAAAAARRELEETARRLSERRREESRSYAAVGLTLGLLLAVVLL